MTVWAVAGATGFIGPHLCRALLDGGHRVVALVRPTSEGAAALDPRATVRTVGYSAPDEIRRALGGVEVCANLIAPTRPRFGGGRYRPGGGTLMADVTGLLLSEGAAAGVRRMVLTSAGAIFGHGWRPIGDTSEPRPDSPYGRARLAAETGAETLARELGIELVVARLTETFGPGSRPHAGLFKAVARGGYRVFGSGRHPHQVTHVSDAVRAIVACGSVPAAAGGRFLVAGPALDLRTWLETIAAAATTTVEFHDRLEGPARVVARTLGLMPWAVRQTGPWQTLDYLVRPRSYDTAASLRALGPFQQAHLATAVAEAMAWYRHVGFAA